MAGSFYTFPGLRESESALFLWQICRLAWNLGSMPGRICGSELILSDVCGKVRTLIIRRFTTFGGPEVTWTQLQSLMQK